MESYRVRANNTATASTNKIHDDTVARQYGFSGGLVPGVDVFAYLIHPVVEHFGAEWLGDGTIRARFHQPVYDGRWVTVTVEPEPAGDGIAVIARDEAGADCALAIARAGVKAPAPAVEDFPIAALPDPRPPASADALQQAEPLGSIESAFDAAKAAVYLEQIGETLPLYRNERIAHPGWLLRRANRILAANVALGPWIHVESEVELYDLVHDGDDVSTRGHVRNVWEAKGHKFVTLDVLVAAGGTRSVLRAEHTAIYEPRPRS